jgi:hypothetical protein
LASVPVAISSGEPRGGDRAADGTETLIADLPDYGGYNTELVHWAVMDSSGNVWMILDTTGQAPVKRYYVEVSPGGAVNFSGTDASSRSSQIACSAGDGSPSGWSLASALAARAKVYSACR